MSDRVVAMDLFGTLVSSSRRRRTHLEVAEAVAFQTGIDRNAIKRTIYPAILETRDPSRRQRRTEDALAEDGARAGLDAEGIAAVERSFSAQLGHEYYEHVLVPEALQALTRAKDSGLVIALVSNCMTPRTEVSAMLAQLSMLDLFDFLFLSSDGQGKKPDPEWFRSISALLQVEPINCLMVGDDPALDIVPARRAGWNTVLIDSRSDSWDVLLDRFKQRNH